MLMISALKNGNETRRIQLGPMGMGISIHMRLIVIQALSISTNK